MPECYSVACLTVIKTVYFRDARFKVNGLENRFKIR